MSKNGFQFIINLVKLPNGYSFESFHQVDLAAAKKKSASKDKPKNTLNRAHRIFRELALDPPPKEELLNVIPEESEPAPRLPQPEVEEEQSVEIRREVEQFQSPAKWYDESSIHEIEKESLPEFFNGRTYKTPGLYLKFRNFIVDLYRRNPTQYLTKIACRRILRGDVNTIMKIHRFLQKEGVINYCASKEGNYNFTSSLFNRSLNNQTKSSILIDKVVDNDEQISTEGVDLTNITVTTVNKCFSKSNRVFCSKCESICGIYWYRKKEQNQKNTQQSGQNLQSAQITSSVLCSDCFESLKGSEIQQYVKTDIIKKIQSGVQDGKAVWSIDDNLKLLHFVSKPTENWQILENQFERKKNFDDIMLQFMQFPIANFQPQKEKPIQISIEDSPSDHVRKMVERLKASKFQQTTLKKEEIRDSNCPQFAKPMLALTKKLCQKLQTNIRANLEIENNIQKKLYEISGMKTITSKKIQNQQALINESNSLKQKQFQENSEFNGENEEDQNEQQNSHDGPDQEGQDNQGEEEPELEDFMDHFDYN